MRSQASGKEKTHEKDSRLAASRGTKKDGVDGPKMIIPTIYTSAVSSSIRPHLLRIRIRMPCTPPDAVIIYTPSARRAPI